MKNFVALDLEMEQPSKEIIQIGISYFDEYYANYNTEVFYITPSQPLSKFISELTGITDEDFDHSKTREECFKDFAKFLDAIKDSCEYEFLTWGCGDVELLRKELTEHNVVIPFSTKRFLDCKGIYIFDRWIRNISTNNRTSLNSALKYHRIEPKGKVHNAGWDAFNTLMLFEHLVDKNRKIIKWKNQGASLN